MTSIFDELRDATVNEVRDVVAGLPKDFLEEVARAIQLEINRRVLVTSAK
ncbi:MAG: hypothetical protein WCE63_13080 [Acidobacteriaceae bacterium]